MRAWDTETLLILPGLLAPRLVCVSYGDWGSPSGLLHHADPGLFRFFDQTLEVDSVLANAVFDLGVVGRRFPQLIPKIFDALVEDRVHDVQIREKLIDIARGFYRKEEDEDGNIRRIRYTLADILLRNLGVKLDKDTWRLRYHDLVDLPLEEWPQGAIDYALGDVDYLHELFEKQKGPEGNFEDEVLTNQYAQQRAHWALHLQSCWGFRTDQEAVRKLEARVRAELEDEVRPFLVEAGFVRPDGSRNTKAAKNLMLHTMGDDVLITPTALNRMKANETTRKEEIARLNISLSEEACLLSNHPLLKKYARYTKLQNLLKKDVKDLKTGTITPVQSYFEVLMETGRTSSSGPNIQNLRREPGVRECFVPRNGYCIIAADYTAAELVSLAQVCIDKFRHSQLAEALNNGIDPHLRLGAQLLGTTYETALEWMGFDKQTAEFKQAKEKRQMAKAGNFGFPGGLGIERFVGYAQGYKLELNHHQAGAIKKSWFDAWPEMHEYFQWINKQQDAEGWYWIVQHRSNRIRGRMTFTQCANTLFQGLTADGAKAALFEVSRRQFCEPRSALYGTRTLNFVHDEILLEAPRERAHEAALELCEVMAAEYNKYTPDVPVKVEPALMNYWSKEAETLWVDLEGNPVKRGDMNSHIAANDRLIPWGEQRVLAA